IAYTLHIGREPFRHRRSIVCQSVSDAICLIRSGDPRNILGASVQGSGLKVAFMFPGGGTQFPGMGRELYENEPVYREQVDLCAELLKKDLKFDIRALLYPLPERIKQAGVELERASAGLPAIFVTEYALAKLLASWGIRPSRMLGHSLGEYT